jgi:hypothetical protein
VKLGIKELEACLGRFRNIPSPTEAGSPSELLIGGVGWYALLLCLESPRAVVTSELLLASVSLIFSISICCDDCPTKG